MKNNIKRYAISSTRVFLAVFLPLLAFGLKDISYDSMRTAGTAGALVMLSSVILKVLWESLVMLLVKYTEKNKV